MRYFLFFFSVVLLYSCSRPRPLFDGIESEITGIDFTNTIYESDTFHVLKDDHIYNGGGVGIGDLNNDGLQDIIFSGNMVSPAIYLNLGDFKFQNISNQFPGLSSRQWLSGVAIVDINGDNLVDIYFTATNYEDAELRKNQLWVNQGFDDSGLPYFEEQAHAYNIDHDGYSTHAAFLDYDLDGDLDLYVLNDLLSERMRGVYKEKIMDGSALNNDHFFQNNGDGTFTDVTVEAGVVIEGFGLGIAVGDINKDGYPDLYISNDYMANDLLYINQKNGAFKNEIATYISYQTRSSMGNDMADINNDGLPEIMTLDMLPQDYNRKKQTISGNSYRYYQNDELLGYEHQYLRNMLHMHNGFIGDQMLPFSEIGQISGVYQTEWSWSPLFADYDNDGDKDLLITNGFPRDPTDKDFEKYKAEVYGFMSNEHVLNSMPELKISNYAFENTGNYTFMDRSKDWGFDFPSISHGASFVDLDNDGDLDYITNNLNEEAFVYRNTTMDNSENKQNSIQIKLYGNTPNTMAIGAKVEVWHDGNYQFYEHFLSRGYISSVSPIIHLGMGTSELIDSIKITWPQQKTMSTRYNIQQNEIIEFDESDAIERNISIPSIQKNLFAKRNDSSIYLHKQSDFIDFYGQQPSIPHKYSQIGPVMAKGDINGDGTEDLVIGATNQTPTTVLLNSGGVFLQEEFDGLTTSKICTEADIAIVDIDNDGDNDVLVVSGGYANENSSDYQHYLYKNENGVFDKIALPIPAFPATVLRASDFDQDGDMDVFIGARIRRGMFPIAESSYVLINENGVLKLYSENKFSLGMVTDAVWSDYDNDGWKDLMITREWNSLVILENDNGKLSIVENNPLQDKSGLWYSITAGDFDQDGDDDFLVGNLGKNHRFTVSENYPMRLYAIDLDKNGTIDPFLTGYWPDQRGKMTEFPVNYLDELSSQSSYFRQLFEDYTSFSFASTDQILAPVAEEEKRNYLMINTTSSFLLWNENGSLEFQELPDVLQLSPLTKTIVHDINNDSYPDIILGGNDYSFDISTGYYDANKGYVMLSKGGEQGFEILAPSESGLLLQGQVGSLLYFEGDTSLVVAGFNRDETLIFELRSRD